MSSPNILILLADQHRASATGYGGNPDVRSPRLDRMAAEGLRMDGCVSIHPLCAPYRACFQTGQPASVNGVYKNEDNLDRSLPTLPQLFREQGYATAYFGKCHWHASIGKDSRYTPPEWRLGWQHWKGWQNGHADYDLPEFDEQGQRLHPHKGRFAPEVQSEQFLEWQEQQSGPWIAQMNWGPPHNAGISEEDLEPLKAPSKQISDELGLGLQDQHFQTPWWWVQSFPQHLITDVVPQPYLEHFDPEQLKIPENVHPDNRKLIGYQLREYYAQIEALDDVTAHILSSLDARGDLENTIVIYTSDHGDWIGSDRDPEQNCRGKGGPSPESVRVPLLLQGPGIEGGRDLDMAINTLDFLPSICGLAGFDAGEGFPGEDLSPILRGEKAPIQRVVEMGLYDWKSEFDGQDIRIVH